MLCPGFEFFEVVADVIVLFFFYSHTKWTEPVATGNNLYVMQAIWQIPFYQLFFICTFTGIMDYVHLQSTDN